MISKILLDMRSLESIRRIEETASGISASGYELLLAADLKS
jgi:hypothetical protein